jgi:hypothetical protein
MQKPVFLVLTPYHQSTYVNAHFCAKIPPTHSGAKKQKIKNLPISYPFLAEGGKKWYPGAFCSSKYSL